MKFLKEQYRLSFRFFRGPLWTYFENTTITFFVIYALSLIGSLVSPSILHTLLAYIQNVIESTGIVQENGGISVGILMFNNLRACALSVFYGVVPFLYLPALPIGLNSSVMGAVTASYLVSDQSILAFFAGILPHGIFEIPALLLAFACGLYFCHVMTALIRKKEEHPPAFHDTLIELTRIYLTIITPLLVVAAFIEAYITPIAMSFFL